MDRGSGARRVTGTTRSSPVSSCRRDVIRRLEDLESLVPRRRNEGDRPPHDAALEVLPVFRAVSPPDKQAPAKSLCPALARFRSSRQTPVRGAHDQRRAAVREAAERRPVGIEVEREIAVDGGVTRRQVLSGFRRCQRTALPATAASRSSGVLLWRSQMP